MQYFEKPGQHGETLLLLIVSDFGCLGTDLISAPISMLEKSWSFKINLKIRNQLKIFLIFFPEVVTFENIFPHALFPVSQGQTS